MILTAPDKSEKLLTRVQAAELLGVHAGTLAVWASKGTHGLPYVKVGKLARYRLSDIQRWLNSRAVTGTTKA